MPLRADLKHETLLQLSITILDAGMTSSCDTLTFGVALLWTWITLDVLLLGDNLITIRYLCCCFWGR
jgi:hypothetical protein